MLLDEQYRGKLSQTCTLCRRPEYRHLRSEWGCDRDASQPWELIECHVCEGRDRECVECHGTGDVAISRCPWSMIGWRERFVVEAAVVMEAGLMPFAGVGWAEMPATFQQALGLVIRERAAIQERIAKRK